MKAWAIPGARCVCTNRDIPSGMTAHLQELWPEVGRVYVLRDVFSAAGYSYGDIFPVAVRLEEIRSPMNHDGVEKAFPLDWFAPISTIDTTKTVEALKKLTLDAMQTGRVDA